MFNIGDKISRAEKSIYENYIELRKKYPINKIKVNELCKLSQVSKSTFYKYFLDVYDLADKLDKLLIDDCFKDFVIDYDIFDEPEKLFSSFKASINKNLNILLIIGNGRSEIHHVMLEDKLLSFFKDKKLSQDQIILLNIISGGYSRVYARLNAYKSQGMKIDEIDEKLTSISINILKNYNKISNL